MSEEDQDQQLDEVAETEGDDPAPEEEPFKDSNLSGDEEQGGGPSVTDAFRSGS